MKFIKFNLPLAVLSLSACDNIYDAINYPATPDYYTSQRREIVEHRKQYYVEFKPGDVFTNTKTLYYTKIMATRTINASRYGEVIQIIPKGTKFRICSVKADFSISANLIEPFFEVEGLNEKNISVIGFRQFESKAPKGYYGGYYYDRKNFEKLE